MLISHTRELLTQALQESIRDGRTFLAYLIGMAVLQSKDEEKREKAGVANGEGRQLKGN